MTNRVIADYSAIAHSTMLHYDHAPCRIPRLPYEERTGKDAPGSQRKRKYVVTIVTTQQTQVCEKKTLPSDLLISYVSLLKECDCCILLNKMMVYWA